MKNITILIFMIILLTSFIYADVRINEIESNPNGDDIGNEWIEFYSSSEIDLNGYNITNGDDEVIELDFNVNGYHVLTLASQWLDNTDERVRLIDGNGDVISESDILSDSSNDDKTWQYCQSADEWKFLDQTKDSENDCDDGDTGDAGEDVELELDWDEDDIIAGKKFEIEVKVYHLEDKDYDVKVWIEDKSEGTIMTERYDDENEEWKSGNYYIDDFITGDGDKSKDMEIRLKEDYEDFEGEALIRAKIRESSTGNVMDSEEDYIDIIEDEDETDDSQDQDADEDGGGDDNGNKDISIDVTNDEVIRLGEKSGDDDKSSSSGSEDGDADILAGESSENRIIYKSKSEYIKEAAIYGFSLLCVAIIILLIMDKKWLKR